MAVKYDFPVFQKCCEQCPEKVNIHDPAKQTARQDFGLLTDPDIKNFIATGGLSDRQFVKRDRFKVAFALRGKEMWADIYDFWTGEKFGYFAFVYNPNNGAWLI